MSFCIKTTRVMRAFDRAVWSFGTEQRRFANRCRRQVVCHKA